MRAKDLAIIIAHPRDSQSDAYIYEANLTIEPWLESGVLSCRSFAVVLIDNQSPGLLTSLKALSDFRDCALTSAVVVKSDINISPFIIDGLDVVRRTSNGESDYAL